MKKRLFSIFALFLTFTLSYAQSEINSYELKGDVKMKEGMYAEALNYYNKAKQVASTPSEISNLGVKISKCQEIIRNKPEGGDTSTSTRIISGRYLETGMEYIFSSAEIKLPSEPVQPSYYDVVIYKEKLLVKSHKDKKTGETLDFIPAGTELPLYEECDLYYSYRSREDSSICFLVFKAVEKNVYGEYNVILRKDGERYLKLDSTPEIKAKRKNNKVQKKVVEAPKTLPVEFAEHWYQNYDAKGNKLADSRKDAEIIAEKVCWLVMRFRYTCPADYNQKITFDIKIIGPDKKVLPVTSEKKGYSTTETITTESGSGVLGVAIGGDKPGVLKKGNYIIEIWHKGAKYYTAEITLS